jgi:hypothetical protein
MIFGARTFSMKPTEGIDHIDAKSPAPQNWLVWKNCMSFVSNA